MLINSKRRETEFAISPLQITQGDLNILRVCLCVIKIKITQFLKVGGIKIRKDKTKLLLYTDMTAYLLHYYQNNWIGDCISLLRLQ